MSKLWTLDALVALVPKKPGYSHHIVLDRHQRPEFVSIRKEATDGEGSWIVRAFKWAKTEGDEHFFEELDLEKAKMEVAKYLAPRINKETLIKEIFITLRVEEVFDVLERVQKKAKVTRGIQKGSCVLLYLRGKKGPKVGLQLTP